MNIYIGNLSYDLSENEMAQLFEEFGEVTSCKIITDKFTGRSKGFGFIEMAVDEEGAKAIEGLNGKDVMGRDLKVSEARPRREESQRY
jgi:RNA recognition motif-containing protein